jgi:hypothetical protein
MREFRLGDVEWSELDADVDGSVRFVESPRPEQRERGFVLGGSEWPVDRTELFLLPPGISAERILAAFDGDGDEVLGQRELASRPDLLARFDADGDRRVTRTEIERRLARLGVHDVADDFVGRWDLDGSGRVEPEELPAGVRPRLRLE